MTQLYKSIPVLFVIIVIFSSCEPKSIDTDPVKLSAASKAWIPFEGSEALTYELITETDTLNWTFNATGKESYFDNVRYLTDQGSLIAIQKDYYADLERQHLEFESPSTEYSIQYHLQKNKGEMGEWDILTVTLTDGFYYHNDIVVVISDDNDYNKGGNYKPKESKTFGGKTYYDIYYFTQERRPFELWFTKTDGVIAFKISSSEPWVLKTD